MTNKTTSSFPLIITGESNALFSEINMCPENTHVFSGTFGGAKTNHIYLYRNNIEIMNIKEGSYILIIEMPITTPTWNIGDSACSTRIIRTEKFIRILLPAKYNKNIKNTLAAYNKNNNNTTRNAINVLICNICAPLFDSNIQLLRQCIERVHYTTWKNIYTTHDRSGDQFMSMSRQRNNIIFVPHPNDSTKNIPIWNDANKILHLYNQEAPIPPEIDKEFYLSPILMAEHPLIGGHPLNITGKVNTNKDSQHEKMRYARILHNHNIEISEYYFR